MLANYGKETLGYACSFHQAVNLNLCFFFLHPSICVSVYAFV